MPAKGKDIIGITPDGEQKEIFRCACHNPNCKEWRCSLLGYGMIIEIEKWRYANEALKYINSELGIKL